MKFKVTFKDPDALRDSVDDAVGRSLRGPDGPKLDDDELDILAEKRTEEFMDLCDKWFEYDEYLTVEVDTDAKTCTVVPR
jgi:hypothetical protein